MDELNNLKDGQYGELNQTSNPDSNPPSNGESNSAPPRLPGRTITSKRVVIPPSAKRSTKAPVPAPAEPLPAAPVVAAAALSPNGEVLTAVEPPAEAVASQTADAAPTQLVTPGAEGTAAAPALEPEPVVSNPPSAESTAPKTPAEGAQVPYSSVWSGQDLDERYPLEPSPALQTPPPPAPSGAGLKPGGLPYTPTAASMAPIAQKTSSRRRGLEFVLWGIAALLLVAAAILILYFVFPDTIAGIGAPQAVVTPTQIVLVQPTAQPQATTTLLPTQAATPLPAVPTSAPLVIPTPPADGNQVSLVADAALTGWVASGEDAPHYGDENLHAGTFQGKNLSSVLQFNLRNLPTDTKILYAAVELTGRDSSRIADSGAWQLDLVENSLDTDWFQATPAQFAAAKSLGSVGNDLSSTELGTGRLNRFILNETERQILEQQFGNGNAVFRLRGPVSSEDNLFTWESGASGSALNAPTLHLVYVPGTYVIVTNTPEPENVLTAAAYVVRGTDQATRVGTPTRFPPGVATATSSLPTLVVPAETAIPANAETARAIAQLATAVARTTGTYTPTRPFVVLFPTHTPVVIAPEDLATATPIPPNTDLITVPINYEECRCLGRIMLLSNRYGGEKGSPIMIEPDGGEVGKLSGDLYYMLALAREPYSPDRTKKIIYPKKQGSDRQQIGIQDLLTNETTFLTNFTKGDAYDGAWAPDGSAIVFVGTNVDNADQIYLYDFGTEQITTLVETPGGQPWFKRPTWSPDSQQIAFWSSVDAGCPSCGQIFVINRDGSNSRNISKNAFDERDPVWVK